MLLSQHQQFFSFVNKDWGQFLVPILRLTARLGFWPRWGWATVGTASSLFLCLLRSHLSAVFAESMTTFNIVWGHDLPPTKHSLLPILAFHPNFSPGLRVTFDSRKSDLTGELRTAWVMGPWRARAHLRGSPSLHGGGRTAHCGWHRSLAGILDCASEGVWETRQSFLLYPAFKNAMNYLNPFRRPVTRRITGISGKKDEEK